jgi:hypothetical protein
MKSFIAIIVLISSFLTHAQDCRRIELHIEKLQEELYQCQVGNSQSNETVCIISKAQYWEVKTAGAVISSYYDFDSAVVSALKKQEQKLCRMKLPICQVKKNEYWDLMANESIVSSYYDFETAVKKALDKDAKGYCRFQRDTCSIEKGQYWDVKIGTSTLKSYYSFEEAAKFKNTLIEQKLCN